MRLLLDFGSIKTGGAVQLATNFIRFFDDYPEDIEAVFLLLPELGPLARIADNGRYEGALTYPDSYLKRKLFELTTLRQFVKANRIDTFFTFLGPGIPAPGHVRSVVSVANATFCYPDSPYWREVPLKMKLRSKVVHLLRRNRVNNADHVFVETNVMADRVKKYVGVAPEKISVLPPSPSRFLSDADYADKPRREKVNFLILSAIYIHKNLRLLPALAHEMAVQGFTNFRFVISVNKDDFRTTYSNEFDRYRPAIDAHFNFTGPIAADAIESVYREADLMINLSDLESFSNNYMEAWKFSLPIVCGDTDFARHICSDSAIYVDPRNPTQAAEAVIQLAHDRSRQRAMAAAGKRLLKNLPSLEQRFELIMNKIRAV